MIGATDLIAALLSHLERTLPAYMDDLRTMTQVDCGTGQKAGIDLVVTLIARRLEEVGAEVELLPHSDAGDDIIGRFRGSGTRRLLLLCHTDTVYPPGTTLVRPFRVEGSRAVGPGVADMKSGLLSALYAVSALLAVGFVDFAEIVILCNSDEEGPPRHSIPLIEAEARRAGIVFCMEAGRANG
ncbi:MAG TPA: M20/M25/M40 family metallo-hydrolase, partial [Chloroflexota bacterium]|nr:M20/M25/M40 family metallo-hydrolase [Chloroflexota bacterium]